MSQDYKIAAAIGQILSNDVGPVIDNLTKSANTIKNKNVKTQVQEILDELYEILFETVGALENIDAYV